MQIEKMMYNGENVLTSVQLAECYGVDRKILNNNFARNKDKYIENIHYYKLEGEALKAYKEGIPQIEEQLKFTPVLVFWTEKGCLLHSKSLNTDTAWAVYEQLVDTYFRAKTLELQLSNLSPQLQLLINVEMQQKAFKEEIKVLTQRVDNIKNIVTLTPAADWRKTTNNIINKIGAKVGDYKTIRELIYTELDIRAKSSIKTRLTNKRNRLLATGASASTVSSINNLDVIGEDVVLTQLYIQIVKEMAIKYDIALE